MLDAWRKASPFGIYYSASPSLGQALQSPLQASQSLDAVRFRGKSLYLLRVTVKPVENRPGLEVLRQTQQQLASKGLTVAFWRYPGLTHGQMFEVSLRSALLHLSGQAALAHQ